jgi:hypothetical protein
MASGRKDSSRKQMQRRQHLIRKKILSGLTLAVVLTVMMLMGTRPAMAQAGAAEFFGGGSFVRNGSTFSGWNVSGTANLRSWLGITADVSGHTHSPLGIRTYTFGPRLAFAQDSSLVPFTQATFGVARLSALGAHSNGFGAYIGGGLDWWVKDHIGVRLMQLDAQLLRVGGSNSSGTRISFGVLFRLGSR